MMRLKDTLKSNFAKSVVMISSSTIIAQVLNAAFSPIITRIYSPEEYGLLTVYSSVLGLIAVIATLKYEWGIPIAKDKNEAINVMALSFFILTLFSLAVLVTFLLAGKWILNLLNAEALSKYTYLIPIGVFFAGLYNIVLYWGYRNKDFKSISRTKLSQSIVGNGTTIGLGLIGVGPIGLIIGQILKQCAGIYTLSKSIRNGDERSKKILEKGKLLENAKRYKNFAIFSTPAQLLNTAGTQLPVFFITSLYGSQVLGLYGLANSVVNLPMVLVGQAVGDVFYGEVASIGRDNPKRVKELSKKLLKRLIMVGLVPLLALLFFGPFLFSFVFGSGWYEAGVYAKAIAFLVFSRLIFTPISRIYSVFERQKEDFFLDLFRVILVVVSFMTAQVFRLSSYVAISLYSAAMSIVYLVTYLVAQKILDQEIKKKEEAETKTDKITV